MNAIIRDRLPVLALTIGDVNGIGPEVLMKALARPEAHDVCRPSVVGSRAVLATYSHRIQCGPIEHTIDGLACGGRVVPVIDIPTDAVVTPGEIDSRVGRLAGEAIRIAALMAMEGTVDAVVTMPISKIALNAGGFAFPGHTEMLADMAGGHPLMVLVAPSMRVAVATGHDAIADVAPRISWTLIENRVRTLERSLRHDFGISRPRIAVLGLNPHAGEHGLIGREEVEVIQPTVNRLASDGIDVIGPLPADGFFARYIPGEFDGVLAMYHDQGLIPVKIAARGGGVNFTAGLPIVRTSPDHGTAMSIAGIGIADYTSTLEAIYTASEIAMRRRNTTAE